MQNIKRFLFRELIKTMGYGIGANIRSSGELKVFKLVKKLYKKKSGLIFFDVGGNVGKYSKALAEYFGDSISIYAFEPSPETYKMFLETTKGIPNIIPNNLGFSSETKKTVLFTNKKGSGLASVYQRNLEHKDTKMDICEEIDLTTIDAYCREQKIDRINFLKLDIEGHELDALKGAQQMINEQKIDFIQFEFGGCNIDSRTYFRDFYYFLKDNFVIYRILKNGLLEIKVYKEIYEIFITVNYLAVRKGLGI
jgi:FkbM family methyltransferase